MKSLKILVFLVLTLVQFSRSQSSKFSVFPRSQGCRCSSFTFRNIHGELVGDCRTTFRVLNRRARLCYVHQPDNCPDAVESSTFPRMKFSERACFQDDDPFIGIRAQNSRDGLSMDEMNSIDENLEDGANDMELDDRSSQMFEDQGLNERDQQVLKETLLLSKVLKPHFIKKAKTFGLNLDSSDSMEDIMESDRQSQTSLLLASLLAKPLAIKHFLAKGTLGSMALQASDEILDEDFRDEDFTNGRNSQKIKSKLLLKLLAKDLGLGTKAVLESNAISSLFEEFPEDDGDDLSNDGIERESQVVKTKLFLKGLLAKELGAKALHNKKALIKAFSRLIDSEQDDLSQEDINRESQSVKKTKLLLLKPLALEHLWKKFASAIAAGKTLKAEQIKKLIKLIEQVKDDNITIADGDGFLEIKINKNKTSV